MTVIKLFLIAIAKVLANTHYLDIDEHDYISPADVYADINESYNPGNTAACSGGGHHCSRFPRETNCW